MTKYEPVVVLKRTQGRWVRVLATKLIKEAEK